MNDETTRLINEPPSAGPTANTQTSTSPYTQTSNSIKSQPTQPQNTSATMKKSNKKYTAAAGGFVAGVATGAAATAAAVNHANAEEQAAPETIAEENNTLQPENEAAEQGNLESPTPEQVILANDEGIRYAHVDAVNFNEAFAQARQQVGPGGVFEYDGKLYGTYYADEWNQMTAQERADYQSRVSEVAPSHHSAPAASHYAEQPHETTPEAVPTNMEMIAAEPVDNEIRVLGVEAVQDENGHIMNVALVEYAGDHVLLVDVGDTGTIDVAVHDDNRDGRIQEQEIHDISGAGIKVDDLIQAHQATGGDALYASMDDGMPDYINDADSTMVI